MCKSSKTTLILGCSAARRDFSRRLHKFQGGSEWSVRLVCSVASAQAAFLENRVTQGMGLLNFAIIESSECESSYLNSPIYSPRCRCVCDDRYWNLPILFRVSIGAPMAYREPQMNRVDCSFLPRVIQQVIQQHVIDRFMNISQEVVLADFR